MSVFVIDASAWIEYFEGSSAGIKVKEIVESNTHEVHTNVVTFAELAGHFIKKHKNFPEAKNIILSSSLSYHITTDFAVEAGMLYAQLKKERKNISLVDVFILLTAKKTGGKVLTGDNDFKGLKEVIMIK